MNEKPLIKLFKTGGKYYLYDTNKNSILNISESQYDTLNSYINDNGKDIDLEVINKLCKEGYLSNKKVKKIISPENETVKFNLERNVEMIILQVTQQCNFRCEYCVYSGSYNNRTHSSKRMSIDTAQKAIDFAISHSKDNYRLAINFYGGEPLLEFDLVKKCIEYAEKKCEGKLLEFYMTTNAYLLKGEILEFLYKHKVRLTISFDGPKKVHDDHRKLALNNSGTFDTVYENIRNIRDNYSDYVECISFNSVIDTKNDFYEIDNFFNEDEVVKNIEDSFSPLEEKHRKTPIEYSEKFNVDREYEVFRIMYYLLRNRTNKKRSKINTDVVNNILSLKRNLKPEISLPDEAHPGGPCIAGCKRLFVNVDGNFFPCEKCDESSEIFKIGDLDSGFNLDKVKNMINIGKVSENECKNCWAINQCDACAAALENTKDEFCKEDKIKLCKGIKESVEEDFKDYCMLMEFGYDFNNNDYQNLLINN